MCCRADGRRIPTVCQRLSFKWFLNKFNYLNYYSGYGTSCIPNSVSQSYSAIAHIDHVIDVTVDQFDGDKILFFTTIEHDEAVGFSRFEHKINVNAGIGSKHGQSDKGVLRFECDRPMKIISCVLDEFSGHFNDRKT